MIPETLKPVIRIMYVPMAEHSVNLKQKENAYSIVSEGHLKVCYLPFLQQWSTRYSCGSQLVTIQAVLNILRFISPNFSFEQIILDRKQFSSIQN